MVIVLISLMKFINRGLLLGVECHDGIPAIFVQRYDVCRCQYHRSNVREGRGRMNRGLCDTCVYHCDDVTLAHNCIKYYESKSGVKYYYEKWNEVPDPPDFEEGT